MPWDQSTIYGYFGEVCALISVGEVIVLVNGVVLLLFISICFHHRAFCEIFRQLIGEWTRNSTERHDREFICRLIRFHVLVQKLRKNLCYDGDDTTEIHIIDFSLKQMVFIHRHHL